MLAVTDPSTLDFRPPTHDVPATLGSPESIQAPAGADLAMWEGGACLVGGGICLRVAPGFDQRIDGVVGLSPALDGPPLLRHANGSIARLGDTLTPLPHAPAGADQLIGLDAKDSFWAAREAEPVTFVSEDGRRLWQRRERPSPVLPVGAVMVRQPTHAPTTLEGIAIRTGELVWTAELTLPAALLGAVGTTVWVALPAGRIVGLNVASGARCVEVTTPAYVPTGPIGADAVLHLVTPSAWTGIDLAAGGHTRFQIATIGQYEGAATVNRCGDLFAADHNGCIWHLHANKTSAPEMLLDTGKEVVKQVAVTKLGLVVLTRQRLHARWRALA